MASAAAKQAQEWHCRYALTAWVDAPQPWTITDKSGAFSHRFPTFFMDFHPSYILRVATGLGTFRYRQCSFGALGARPSGKERVCDLFFCRCEWYIMFYTLIHLKYGSRSIVPFKTLEDLWKRSQLPVQLSHDFSHVACFCKKGPQLRRRTASTARCSSTRRDSMQCYKRHVRGLQMESGQPALVDGYTCRGLSEFSHCIPAACKVDSHNLWLIIYCSLWRNPSN